jgi:glycine cleavage system H protein
MAVTIPSDLKYARSDEWVRLEGGTATVGITDFAQGELNDIVFVELPETGAQVTRGQAFGVVESVKAASDIYAPVSGTVAEVNTALQDQPELINHDPYGRGWIATIRVGDASELDAMMDSQAYAAYLESR